jgi:sugar/nucleoside kinase (ribokinase family)
MRSAAIVLKDVLKMTISRINDPQQDPCGLFVGLSTIDLAYLVADMPGRNSKSSALGQQVAAGGPAANAAVTFAFLGGKSALVSAVGQHPLSAVIRHDLKRFTVSLYDFAGDHTEAPPVSSILIVPNGERTVISANARAFPEVGIQPDSRWFDEVSIILVDGHYMSVCDAVAAKGRARGLNVVLDAGSWKEGTYRLLSNTNIAICSHDFRPPGCESELDVVGFLTDHGVERLAITRGADSILYTDKGTSGEISVERINPIDTTGAGDVFHGAFCYRFSKPGTDFVRALTFAARVATFSCLHIGTRSWMDTFPAAE